MSKTDDKLRPSALVSLMCLWNYLQQYSNPVFYEIKAFYPLDKCLNHFLGLVYEALSYS